MSRLILDIETVGKDLDSFDDMSKDYLLKFAKTEEDIQEVKDSLSFYPLTGEIVAIGILNPDTDRGAVYYQSPQIPQSGELFTLDAPQYEEDGFKFIPGSEREIIERFWETVKNYSHIITFNGRGFDCPFIIVRSAILKIKPAKDLMPNRYNDSHIDLLDQLTFFGAVRRRFSLHMWCRAFGIKSPKEEGITGYDVKSLFLEKRYLDIARYCTGDLKATKELYNCWERYIRFQRGE